MAARMSAMAPSEIGISIVVLYELEAGIAKSRQARKRRKQFDAFLAVTKIWLFDRAAARQRAMLRAMVENKGTPLGPMDCLIAGIAVAQGATLVTRITADFARVTGLGLVDWY